MSETGKNDSGEKAPDGLPRKNRTLTAPERRIVFELGKFIIAIAALGIFIAGMKVGERFAPAKIVQIKEKEAPKSKLQELFDLFREHGKPGAHLSSVGEFHFSLEKSDAKDDIWNMVVEKMNKRQPREWDTSLLANMTFCGRKDGLDSVLCTFRDGNMVIYPISSEESERVILHFQKMLKKDDAVRPADDRGNEPVLPQTKVAGGPIDLQSSPNHHTFPACLPA